LLVIRRNLRRVEDEDPGRGVQEGREGLGQRELHRLRIDRRDAVRAEDVGEHPGHALVEREDALGGEDDRLGGDRRAIAEGGPLVNGEGPFLRVFRDGVLGGQPGNEFRRVSEVAVEGVVDMLLGHRDRAVVADRRIDVRNVDGTGENPNGPFLPRQRGGSGHNQRATQPGQRAAGGSAAQQTPPCQARLPSGVREMRRNGHDTPPCPFSRATGLVNVGSIDNAAGKRASS
jgi:hypothetical protein